VADWSTYCEDPSWDSAFIYADHKEVCKFYKRDTGYEEVIDKLKCYLGLAKAWNVARVEKLKRELSMELEDSEDSCDV